MKSTGGREGREGRRRREGRKDRRRREGGKEGE